jgi:hypothetical protein
MSAAPLIPWSLILMAATGAVLVLLVLLFWKRK